MKNILDELQVPQPPYRMARLAMAEMSPLPTSGEQAPVEGNEMEQTYARWREKVNAELESGTPLEQIHALVDQVAAEAERRIQTNASADPTAKAAAEKRVEEIHSRYNKGALEASISEEAPAEQLAPLEPLDMSVGDQRVNMPPTPEIQAAREAAEAAEAAAAAGQAPEHPGISEAIKDELLKLYRKLPREQVLATIDAVVKRGLPEDQDEQFPILIKALSALEDGLKRSEAEKAARIAAAKAAVAKSATTTPPASPETPEQPIDFHTAKSFDEMNTILQKQGANDLLGAITDIRDLANKVGLEVPAFELALNDLPEKDGLRDRVRELLKAEVAPRGSRIAEALRTLWDRSHAKFNLETMWDEELAKMYDATVQRHTQALEANLRAYEFHQKNLKQMMEEFQTSPSFQLEARIKRAEWIVDETLGRVNHFDELRRQWEGKRKNRCDEIISRIDLQLRPYEARANYCEQSTKEAVQALATLEKKRVKLTHDLAIIEAEGARTATVFGLVFDEGIRRRINKIKAELEGVQMDIRRRQTTLEQMDAQRMHMALKANEWRTRRKHVVTFGKSMIPGRVVPAETT